MAYSLGSRKLRKVGIVGSGQIGPDIALHMSKVLHEHGVPVVVVDIAEAALAAGRTKIEGKLAKGVESKAFTPEEAAAIQANLSYTKDYAALEGADFVIEAASEDLAIKRRIFAALEKSCAHGAILASNSSHLEPERIFEKCEDPSRTLVIHYFFPAERNLLVELVPGARTAPKVKDWLLKFYEEIGKVPIAVQSRYGYAIDPIFEGIFQAACLCVEEGLGSVKEVDTAARKALGLGVGPFTAMNLTGGNPLTAHGLDEMHERVNRWFRTPELMKQAVASGRPWETPTRGEKVELPAGSAKTITERMQGAYLGLVGEVYDSGIVSLADFEMALEIGLVVRPPFAFMNELGPRRALELVQAYARVEPDFPVAGVLVRQAELDRPWEVPVVLRREVEEIALLTIRRPQVLNALNAEVYAQLDAHFARIAEEPAIRGAVVTGFGKKAFVSGADIGMLAAVKSPADGEKTSRASHAVLHRIENMRKPVICAYNGLAFGGGNELALACHARLAPKGLKLLAAQPEPNLGIIPGAGATQRLPRLVGFERAWSLLRTGRPFSSADARQMGLLHAEVEGDLLEAAVELARQAAAGKVVLRRIERGPVTPPAGLPEVELGHLSKAVDRVLVKAILEGAKLPLEKGLAFESKCFGEVCGLEDMRIGMDNFIKNGPRAKAAFLHK
ncbi:MAG: 3-hydroxyacyl-CoA dehydrogenase/enoyl-CoA hydratase family protein [Planctomycetaceae bacterium]